MLTMLLGGLWHGAGVFYLLWGFYHGTLLVIHRVWRTCFPAREIGRDDWRRGILRGAAVLLFFHLVCVGWLFFRAGALSNAGEQRPLVSGYLHALIRWPHGWSPFLQPLLLLGGLSLFFQYFHREMDQFSEWRTAAQATAVVAALAALLALGVFEGAQFIYFQF